MVSNSVEHRTDNITAREMNAEEFDYFKLNSVVEYANELQEQGGLSKEEANTRAKNEFDAILSEENWKQVNSFYIISNQKSEDVGCIWLYRMTDGNTFIADIHVYPNHRNMGYGTKIMNFAIETARKNNSKALILSVIKNNLPAISLYKKLGFIQFDGNDTHYNMYLTV